MNLVKISDLVGKNIAGTVADLRVRNADGSLRYDWQEKIPYHEYTAQLKEVRIEAHKIRHDDPVKSPWLYWYWDSRTGGHSCGFSGIADQNEWNNYHIMIEEISP